MVDDTNNLYIPFWLNLYTIWIKQHRRANWPLHSILVKSILYCPFIGFVDVKPLHSILVKSIPIFNRRKCIPISLYIPFWLNLYCKKCCKPNPLFWLYIPFWLNLYFVKNPMRAVDGIFTILKFVLLNNRFTLHSILVKSIPCWAIHYFSLSALYIPFWLNLYFCFKILRNNALKLYIPFWLNLYTTLMRILFFMSAFTFHSG